MKKVKGMTLFEIVISMGVYALLALLLAEIMSVVNNTMTATNQLNERMAFQAKFADNKMTNGANLNTTGHLTVSYGDNDTTVGSFNRMFEDDDTSELQFNEYSGIYTHASSDAAVTSVEEVNFRFMTFRYREEETAEYPGLAFSMHVMLLPYTQADGLTVAQERDAQAKADAIIKTARKIVITANGHLVQSNELGEDEVVADDTVITLANDDAAKEYVKFDAEGDSSMTKWIHFNIENLASHPTENQVSNKDTYDIVVTFYNASNEKLVEVHPEQVYMYVKRGSTESYYQQCAVALDLHKALSEDPTVRQTAIRVCRSKIGDDGYTANEINPPLLTPEEPGETPEDPGETPE